MALCERCLGRGHVPIPGTGRTDERGAYMAVPMPCPTCGGMGHTSCCKGPGGDVDDMPTDPNASEGRAVASALGMLNRQIDARIDDKMPLPDVLYVDLDWLPQLVKEMSEARMFTSDLRDDIADQIKRGNATYRGVRLRLSG